MTRIAGASGPSAAPDASGAPGGAAREPARSLRVLRGGGTPAGLRVAHVVPVFPPYRGGMGNVAFHQARALARAGVAVTVFTPRRRLLPVTVPGAQVIALAPLLARGNAACLPAVLRRTQAYDLVHLHYPFFGTAELLAARRLVGGAPVVLQYQMDVVGKGWRALAFRWHRRLLLPLIVRAADAVIVSSRDYAETSFLARWLPDLDARLAAIPPGVDLAHFAASGAVAAPDGATGRPRIFFLAALDRAHYFKGLDVLFAALQHLPEATLIVGGEGELRPWYEAAARGLGIAPRVRFVGQIPDEQLPSFYRAADVVVVPSIDRTEAFGMVLLEAMACGKPVVASRLPGVRTLVTDGENGHLAEAGNAADLADKIARCAERAAALGARGRRLVEERFSSVAVGEQLLTLYQRLLSSTGRRALPGA